MTTEDNSTPQDIPLPQVLDPHRILAPERDDMSIEDHRDRADRLQDGLTASCEYGQQLWRALDAVRTYLVDSLPGEGRGTAAPDGPNDDAGWNAWKNVYAAATSTLAGTHGDNGFGAQEAQLISQHRRV